VDPPLHIGQTHVAAGVAVGYVVDAVSWAAEGIANGFAIIGDWLSEIGGWFSDAFSGAVDAIAGFVGDAYAAAADFVQGIIDGISDGVGAVADAAANLAQGALDAVTGLLGISSPSRVMRLVGGYTAEGMEEGLDAGAKGVRSSMQEMVGLADVDTGQPARRGAGTQSTTTTTSTTGGNTYQITINAPSGDAEDIRATLEQWFVSTLDAAALEVGGGEVPA
jgi:phage-related protein